MKSDVLVRSRLRPSFSRTARVRRSRLLEHILGNEFRLVVVQGPGGSGKSTLIYDAMQEMQQPFAWYSVQAEDRNVHIFAEYLLAAVATVAPQAAERAGAALGRGDDALTEAITLLINDVLDLGQAVRVVLDDVHLVAQEPQIAELLRSLVLDGPPNLHLYLTTREPLRLPLPRLRTKGHALVLQAADLELNPAEVRTLFRDIWHLPMQEDLLELIMTRTGGWITGLVLVQQALHMRQRRGRLTAEATREFIESLSGDNSYIFDYLTEEILQTVPRDIQHFLKETSILDQFDVDAAAFVSGDDHAQETLDSVERRGLFLLHLDDEARQYRYHHLFQSFLCQALQREVGPDGVLQRHARVGAFYESRNVGEAIHHYFKAESWARAQALLEEHGRTILESGWTERVHHWLSQLPPTVLMASTPLRLLAAAVSELKGNWILAVRTYEDILKAAAASGQRMLQAQVLEKAAVCLVRYGDRTRMQRFMEEALQLCPQDDLGLRSRALTWMGAIMLDMGRDPAQAYELIREGYRISYESGDPEAIAAGCISYGFVYSLSRGQFASGVRALNEGIELFRKLNSLYMIQHLMMNRATVQIIGGELDEASSSLQEAEDLGASFEDSFVGVALSLNRAMLSIERHDLAGAEADLATLRKLEVPLQIKPWYLRTVILLSALQGRFSEGDAAGAEMLEVLRTRGENGFYGPECYLSLAYLHGRQGRLEEGLRYAERALKVARQSDMPFWEMKANGYLVWLHGVQTGEGVAHLERALALTVQEGYYGWWEVDFLRERMPFLLRARALPRGVEMLARLYTDKTDQLVQECISLVQTRGFSPDGTAVVQLLQELKTESAVQALKELKGSSDAALRKAATRALRDLPQLNTMLEIKTLGRLEIIRNGTTMSSEILKRKKILQLLKLMLSSQGCMVMVDVATEILWPDIPLEKARHNLNVHVTLLRNLLYPDRSPKDRAGVMLAGDCYRLLVGETLQVDWLQFQELVTQAEVLFRQGALRESAALYTTACHLYQGEFLPEDVYEDWANATRERLKRLHGESLANLCDIHLRLDDPAEAVRWSSRMLAIDPTSETACRSLLQACAAAGDRATAIREYHVHCQALEADGWEPSPETTALVERLFALPAPISLAAARRRMGGGRTATAEEG